MLSRHARTKIEPLIPPAPLPPGLDCLVNETQSLSGDALVVVGPEVRSHRSYHLTWPATRPADDPPTAVDDSFFGFDVTGDLDANRVVGLGRMGAMNGLFALEGAIWRAFTASPSISAQSVLTD